MGDWKRILSILDCKSVKRKEALKITGAQRKTETSGGGLVSKLGLFVCNKLIILIVENNFRSRKDIKLSECESNESCKMTSQVYQISIIVYANVETLPGGFMLRPFTGCLFTWAEGVNKQSSLILEASPEETNSFSPL